MKQVFQSLKNGTTSVQDVPSPICRDGHVVIASSVSLVSPGTERMLIDFGKSNVFQKAKSQPDKVRDVIEKAKTDGIAATMDAVRSKLDQPFTPGYCNIGRVTTSRVNGFKPGDRVVSNGHHAEVVHVPKHLCAKIPKNVSDEAACFTILGAISLQGVRLANPTIGETVVVTGLGLIGLLTVQILRAHGCKVLGIDIDPSRRALAASFGAEVVDPVEANNLFLAASQISRNRGVDAVIITASAQSNELLSQAAQMCRKRGRIVLVGVVGLDLRRSDFYEKELTFQVACSYGPGRYDENYESGGHDYPIGFVRWTEQRNFEAVLDLMESGALDTASMVTHRFTLADSPRAMELISSRAPALGVIIEYPSERTDIELASPLVKLSRNKTTSGVQAIAFLGAGNYASRFLIPAFKKTGAELHTIVSQGGVNALYNAKKHGFKNACTDEALVMSDPNIDTVVIATRHDLHARQVVAALEAGKNVFCEKPLCITLSELQAIRETYAKNSGQKIFVGFNRRYSPLVRQMKEKLESINQPKSIIMTVNAGQIPSDHWAQNPIQGGGRIIGEACHFIDLAHYLVGEKCENSYVLATESPTSVKKLFDTATINLSFSDGSTTTIHYLANGHKSFSKERIEVFTNGRILRLDNFRTLEGWGWPNFSRKSLWRQNKGQAECAQEFLTSTILSNRKSAESLFDVSQIAIELAEKMHLEY